jgi:bicarbonate transport system ATP-binding protein
MQNNNLRTTNTATSTINRQPFLEIKDVCKIYPTKKVNLFALSATLVAVNQLY